MIVAKWNKNKVASEDQEMLLLTFFFKPASFITWSVESIVLPANTKRQPRALCDGLGWRLRKQQCEGRCGTTLGSARNLIGWSWQASLIDFEIAVAKMLLPSVKS